MSKRIISIILTLVLIASVSAAGGFSAAADKDLAQVKADVDLAVIGDEFQPSTEEAAQQLLAEAEKLPDSIDLRNYNGMNYVTPVKFQNPFGTCWAFGIVGASEISYIYDNGLGVPAGEVNNAVDFSEKYIAWYIYHLITADDVKSGAVRASQIGEGYDPSQAEESDINAVYNFGGYSAFASGLFAAGQGPVMEDVEVNDFYPFYYAGQNRWRQSDREMTDEVAAIRQAYFKEYYRPYVDTYIKEGYFQTADEYDDWFDTNWGEGFFLYTKSFSRSNYAGYDDWSLPLSAEYRYPGVVTYFKNSYILPDIVSVDSEGNCELNPVGVAAVKIEISNGHGVAISYLADQSRPNQEAGDTGYMNTTNWAQYYNGEPDANHCVTVVGYDDNYPKENFTRTAHGEVVEGSTPPGDGAFIVKNSWGALSEEDKATVTYDIDGNPVYVSPDANGWGYEDSGYFYLSYYDHGIRSTESFGFYKKDELKYTDVNYDQYDLLMGSEYEDHGFDSETKMANIFDAEEDEFLYQISYMSTAPLTTVHYAVYRDVEDDDPCSGILLEEGDNTNFFGGYQRFDLKKEYLLQKGEKYSVVITQKHNTEAAEEYDLIFAYALEDDDDGVEITGVINPGESYYFNNGKWYDMSDEEVRKLCVDLIYDEQVAEEGEEQFLEDVPKGKDGIKIDNFPIKAFLVSTDVKGFEYLLGDADCDGVVTVLDATAIQRDLADIEKLGKIAEILADADGDGVETIFDATSVQKWLASLPCPNGIGKPVRKES